MTEKEVFDWLAQVQHPGKDDKDIVSLGMVEEVVVDGGKVIFLLQIQTYKRKETKPMLKQQTNQINVVHILRDMFLNKTYRKEEPVCLTRS